MVRSTVSWAGWRDRLLVWRCWAGPRVGKRPVWRSWRSGGGQHPGAVAVGQATAGEVAQVQGSGAPLEPGVVVGDAQVAQLEAAAATAGELGDDPLHVGSVAPVAFPQVGVVGPLAAGLAQQGVVPMRDELAAGLGGGAPAAQRAGAAPRTEGGDPGGTDRPG